MSSIQLCVLVILAVVSFSRWFSRRMRKDKITVGYPNFIDKGIKGVDRSGRGSFFLCFLLQVRKPLFHLPPICHPIDFFPSLGGGEFVGRISSRPLVNLLAVCVPSHASFELKGHNFLSFCLFMNVSRSNRLLPAKDLKMTLLLIPRADPNKILSWE